MTLMERKLKILDLDPDKVVEVGLDCFHPHVTFTYPNELECDDIWEWMEDVYLPTLQQYGRVEGMKRMRCELLIETMNK